MFEWVKKAFSDNLPPMIKTVGYELLTIEKDDMFAVAGHRNLPVVTIQVYLCQACDKVHFNLSTGPNTEINLKLNEQQAEKLSRMLLAPSLDVVGNANDAPKQDYDE